jgi:hypothetical protein
MDQTRRDWRSRPAAEYNCLGAHNMSAEQLAASGIGPNDRRVQKIFAECARDASSTPKAYVSPVVTAPAGPYNPDFSVDGLALGGAVYPDSPAYKAYACHPSDQFPGFTWCAIKRSMTGKLGPYHSFVTILHSEANSAVFIEQEDAPAFFAPGDVQREIQRLSQSFGQAAKILNGDPRPDAQHTVIATWGDVTLTPLDDATMGALRRNETITAGLVVDFLGDAKKSAREELPVFHMGGGAGYVWTAKFDASGKGALSFSAINANMLPAGSVEPAPPSIPHYAPTPTPTPAPDPAQVEKIAPRAPIRRSPQRKRNSVTPRPS